MPTSISFPVRTFEASWNDNIQHLNPEQRSTIQKISSFINDAAFFLPNSLFDLDGFVKSTIMPATTIGGNNILFDGVWDPSIMFEWAPDLNLCRNYFEREDLQVTTPDGIKLNGTLFKNKSSSNNNISTLIVDNGNGELYKGCGKDWLWKLLGESPISFNIVMFDHRECGESEGVLTSSNDLILDIESFYQYVQRSLGVEEDKIYFYGNSLGAAIISQVKALHPENHGFLVADRGFQTLHEEIRGFIKTNDILGDNIPDTLLSIAAFFVSWIAYLRGWNLDTVSIWDKMSGKRLVLNHPDDPVIPWIASLFKGLQKSEKTENTRFISLKNRNDDNSNPHNAIPPQLIDQEGNEVFFQIRDFFNEVSIRA